MGWSGGCLRGSGGKVKRGYKRKQHHCRSLGVTCVLQRFMEMRLKAKSFLFFV